MSLAKKMRLDEILVLRGYAEDICTARALIMEGRTLVNEIREDKPGLLVSYGADIRVRSSGIPYASRGGLKLEAAIREFGIRVKDRVAIDAGASAGGFTDCLIKHGAGLVYAVDVGYGQLVGRLRQNPRVQNMEKINIGDPRLLTLDPRPDLGVIDLSYLSLTKAVPLVAAILDRGSALPEIVALVKPLFEVKASGPHLAREQYEEALLSAARSGQGEGYVPMGIMHSPLLGLGGTLEFLLHLSPGSGGIDLEEAISRSVEAGMTILHRSIGGESGD